VTRKARLNENNLSGTYHLAELSLNKDLGTKSAQQLCKSVMIRGIAITAEFRI
jgi:hypothetical protein